MIFSSPAEYAMRGLSELALRGAGAPIMLDELVAGTDLPRDFLAKIFQKLVHAKILRSVKGRGGGFWLGRPAEKITLMDIVQAIDGRQAFDHCVVGLEKCNDEMPCPQHELYKPLRQRFKEYLQTSTLADLAAALDAKRALPGSRAASRSARPRVRKAQRRPH